MKLIPLIFYNAHEDPATYDFLFSSVEFLKSCGYKSVCIESHIPVKKLIKLLVSQIKDTEFYNNILQINENRLNEMNAETIAVKLMDVMEQARPGCLSDRTLDETIVAVACDLKRLIVYKKQLLFYKSIIDDFEIIHADAVERVNKSLDDTMFDDIRNISFARTLKEQAEHQNGGTILIGGAGHSERIKELLAQEQSFNYCDMFLYNSVLKAALTLNSKKHKAAIENISEKHDVSGLNRELVFDNIYNIISRYFLEYEKVVEPQSTVARMNETLNVSFKGYLRYGGKFFVDAVLSDDNAETIQKILQTLRDRNVLSEIKTVDRDIRQVVPNVNETGIAKILSMGL